MADERELLTEELAGEEIQNDSDVSANSLVMPIVGTPSEVVQRYTHCPLCGANLHFSHVTDFSRNMTQESAKCPECGLKARRVMHRLQ